MHLSLVRILIAAADLGEGPGPHLTLGKNKKESQKEEKPAGQATPSPPLAQGLGPPLVCSLQTFRELHISMNVH